MKEIISINVFYRSNQSDGVNYQLNRKTIPEQNYLDFFFLLYRNLPDELKRLKKEPNQELIKKSIIENLNEIVSYMRPGTIMIAKDVVTVMQLVYLAVEYELIPNDEFNGIQVITPENIELHRKLLFNNELN